MESIQKLIMQGVGLLVMLGLIGTALYVYRSSGKVVQASKKMLDSELTEYTTSDLTRLDGDVVYGSQLLSLVRQYQTSIPVRVQTVNLNVTDYPGTSLAVVNSDQSSPSWIDPGGVFDVAVERTANGAPLRITATARGISTSTTETVTDVNVAKGLVANALGVDLASGATWDYLVKQIADSNSSAVKQSLVEVVGGTASSGMGWAELTEATRAKINSLQAQVTELSYSKETNSAQKLQGSIRPGDFAELAYTPSVIAVITETGAEVFQSGVWHGGSSCSLEGTTLYNQSGYSITYYAYK